MKSPAILALALVLFSTAMPDIPAVPLLQASECQFFGANALHGNSYAKSKGVVVVQQYAPLAVAVPAAAPVFTESYPQTSDAYARAAALRAEARALEAKADAVESASLSAATCPLATSHAAATVQTYVPTYAVAPAAVLDAGYGYARTTVGFSASSNGHHGGQVSVLRENDRRHGDRGNSVNVDVDVVGQPRRGLLGRIIDNARERAAAVAQVRANQLRRD